MKSLLTLFVGLLIAVILLSYMFAYQVRYDEVAVITTFGQAGENSTKNEPKLYLRAFWPIQQVRRFSTRLNVAEGPLQELITNEDRTMVVKGYLVWRVDPDRPLDFIKTMQTEYQANEKLRGIMMDVSRQVVSQYRFAELFDENDQNIKLADLEDTVLKRMKEQVNDPTHNFGIQLVQFGFSRILMPEGVTEDVFNRMRSNRERLAEAARASGRARARDIISDAHRIETQIIAFADSTAQQIRAQGEKAAGQYIKEFKDDQNFAIFLLRKEALKKMLSHNTTFILSADNLLSPDAVFSRNPVLPIPTDSGNPK